MNGKEQRRAMILTAVVEGRVTAGEAAGGGSAGEGDSGGRRRPRSWAGCSQVSQSAGFILRRRAVHSRLQTSDCPNRDYARFLLVCPTRVDQGDIQTVAGALHWVA